MREKARRCHKMCDFYKDTGIGREAVLIDIRLDCFDSLYASRSHCPTTWANTLREPHASPLRFTHTMGATCTYMY